MKHSKKHRRTKRKIRLSYENSVNLGALPEIVAGFPIQKGMKNNLWNWNTLQEIKL